MEKIVREEWIMFLLDKYQRINLKNLPTQTTDQSAQLVEYWTSVGEVVGLYPGQTNTQGLQITE